MTTPHFSPIAFLFPGQGSQAVGMGKELAALYPVAKETFDEADDALGYKLSQLCFEGPEDQLKLTETTQPAILTMSVAAWRVLQSKAIVPSYVAGHSLGEYSAHVAAGTLSFADAVRTVRNRGKYMQEAVPVGVGAMAAILALSCEKVQQVCEEANVVFVAVRQDDRPHMLLVFDEIRDVRNHNIDAQQLRLRKHQSGVNHDNVVFPAQREAVHSELTETARGYDFQLFSLHSVNFDRTTVRHPTVRNLPQTRSREGLTSCF